MDRDELTPHGRLLEEARGPMSKREAARRAGISEGRWRQIVTGVQKSGELRIPVNPKRETLIAMARAVHTFVPAVLEAAGMSGDVSDDEVTGPSVDVSFVSHSGPRVAAGVTNEDVLAAIAAMRADVDARVERLEAQVAGIENKFDEITGGRQ